jgi:tRNA pseudouridine55 synthase
MYSAVKHQGERLYKLARQGLEVERQPREVTIFAIDLLELALPEVEIDVHCSKGTYVRTLAEDLGEVLGCGGHVIGLRRTGVGPFVEGAVPFVTMERLEALAGEDTGSDSAPPAAAANEALPSRSLAAIDALLLPQDSALRHWPEVRLSEDACFYLRQGQAVLVPRAPTEGLVRLYDPSRRFIGVGEILDDGMVQPKRLL